MLFELSHDPGFLGRQVAFDPLNELFDHFLERRHEGREKRAIEVPGSGSWTGRGAVVGIDGFSPFLRMLRPLCCVDEGGFLEPHVPRQHVAGSQQVARSDVECVHHQLIETIDDL